MPLKAQQWGAAGEALLAGASDSDAVDIATAAARIQALAAARLVAKPPPVLLNAREAAKLLGPSFTAKWLYNHAQSLPPACVRRIGCSIYFVGPKLLEWACDTAQTVTMG
jgi:hypothetical protein